MILNYFSWFSIIRLGIVQMCLGSVLALTNATLNRVMIVELTLLAFIPGILIALHYAVQITRPNWGYLSDKGGNRTKWILIGLIVLCFGAIGATISLFIFERNFSLGLIFSTLSYALIGVGVGASGTSLLAFLATGTKETQRGLAATITWLMMILGAIITAFIISMFIEPYSHLKLLQVILFQSLILIILCTISLWKIEEKTFLKSEKINNEKIISFKIAFQEIFSEKLTRLFTIFVFVAMTAYYMQDLILEPYAGLIFNYTVQESTQLSGFQNAGALIGMIVVGVMCTIIKLGSLKFWVFIGCVMSSISLILIGLIGLVNLIISLKILVCFLGFSNGVFAVAAIGCMMQLAGYGRHKREGTRMGLWGASQAIAAGFGGLVGTGLLDLSRIVITQDNLSFAIVFFLESILFIIAALISLNIKKSENEKLNLKQLEMVGNNDV